MDRGANSALAAGLISITAVHLAYTLNFALTDLEACWPYWEGCLSVSRAVRSGPGLWLFKIAAVPMAGAMILAWLWLPALLAGPLIRWLGALGAVFLLAYALALGSDGGFYSWMRRFGVVFYFGLTGLAQLLTAAALNRQCAFLTRREKGPYLAVLLLTWMAGIASALKRDLVQDAALVDRLENALEWWFALGLSLAFVALSGLVRRVRDHAALEEPDAGV